MRRCIPLRRHGFFGAVVVSARRFEVVSAARMGKWRDWPPRLGEVEGKGEAGKN